MAEASRPVAKATVVILFMFCSPDFYGY